MSSNDCRKHLVVLSISVQRASTEQVDGSLVDEETLAEPVRPAGAAALAAEQALRQSSLATSAVSLRLGGIYGPQRVPYLKQIIAGEPLAVPSQGWLNLVHVEDAVQIIELLCQAPLQHHLYLVTDGVPVLRQDYLNEIAQIAASARYYMGGK